MRRTKEEPLLPHEINYILKTFKESPESLSAIIKGTNVARVFIFERIMFPNVKFIDGCSVFYDEFCSDSAYHVTSMIDSCLIQLKKSIELDLSSVCITEKSKTMVELQERLRALKLETAEVREQITHVARLIVKGE
jgi:hypothetical protein